jgi:uncharacterized protein (TIGR03084 family)
VPADLPRLISDLTAETAEFTAMVSGLDDDGWQVPTPAVGWTIADQVSHLAFFDDAAVLSATDPAAFTDKFAASAASGELSTDEIAAQNRNLTGAGLLAWFGTARRQLIATFGPLDPTIRLPWFGPPMSAASAVTARIMETWAHGQDVADALGLHRVPTARLAHIAHLGVRALPYSFAVHGLAVPAEPVRVELSSPGGELWTWGPADAADRVTGPALDFGLLVTQRRHRADTAVVADGPVATQWLGIAQAFAGPPGAGRVPGQHDRPGT